MISTSFGDIFYNNCFKNGILPIKVSPEDLEKLFDDADRGANATLSIDLEAQEIRGPDGGVVKFEIDAVPQALHAQRPRRCRPDHGQEGQDRLLRRQGESRAAVGVRSALRASAVVAGRVLRTRKMRPSPRTSRSVRSRLQIVETDSGEKELRHGTRVLAEGILRQRRPGGEIQGHRCAGDRGRARRQCLRGLARGRHREGRQGRGRHHDEERVRLVCRVGRRRGLHLRRAAAAGHRRFGLALYAGATGCAALACWCSGRSRAAPGPISTRCSIIRSRCSTSRRSTRRCAS